MLEPEKCGFQKIPWSRMQCGKTAFPILSLQIHRKNMYPLRNFNFQYWHKFLTPQILRKC